MVMEDQRWDPEMVLADDATVLTDIEALGGEARSMDEFEFPSMDETFEWPVKVISAVEVELLSRQSLSDWGMEALDSRALARIAHRAGARDFEPQIHDTTVKLLQSWLEPTLSDTVTQTEHARRRVVVTEDVTEAMSDRGQPLYGWGCAGITGLWVPYIRLVTGQVHADLECGDDCLQSISDMLSESLRTIAKRGMRLAQHGLNSSPPPPEATLEAIRRKPSRRMLRARTVPIISRAVHILQGVKGMPPVTEVHFADNEHQEGIDQHVPWSELPVLPDAQNCRTKIVLSARDIQTAVRLVVPGDLAMHAVSEGTKAVTKFTSSNDGTMASRAGLQFCVEEVAAVVQHLPGCGAILLRS